MDQAVHERIAGGEMNDVLTFNQVINVKSQVPLKKKNQIKKNSETPRLVNV